jgi:hypothetical protein
MCSFRFALAGLAAILLPVSLHAQVLFQRTYGGTEDDEAFSVQQTADHGYVMAGLTLSYAPWPGDVYLIRTDSIGDTVWTRSFGGDSADCAYSVRQTSDSGYIVAGYTNSFGAGSYDFYLIKTDVQGETLWVRTYGGHGYDQGRTVQQTLDGGYIVAGYTNSFAAGNFDVYLVKANAQGDTLWTRTYGGTSSEDAWSVQQTRDSGYIVAGYTSSFGAGGNDVYLVKTDAAGDTQWTRTYGGSRTDVCLSARQTLDGGYIMAGYTESYGHADDCVYLIKTNATGDTQWTRVYGEPRFNEGMSVQPTLDSGYIVTGYTNALGAGDYDVWLLKTDAAGDTQWTRTFGGTAYDAGRSVQQTPDGGYVVAGYTNSFGPGTPSRDNMYLIRTDPWGYDAVAEPETGPTRAPVLALSCEPNPSSGTTRISLAPPASGSRPVALRAYDASGRLAISVMGIRASSFPFDLRALPSGTYFLRLDAGTQHASARLVLQR